MAKAASRKRGRAGGAGAHLWLIARHDLRQPVQALALLASAAAKARSVDERRTIEASLADVAATLGSMVELMTMLARIETGERPPARTTLALEACVTAARAGLDGLACRIEAGGLDGEADADPELGRLVVQGILLCAVRAAGRRSPLHLRTLRRRGRVILEVRYEGRDPAPLLETQGFVEVAPEDADGAQPRVGLGLALAQRCARAMSGTVQVGTEADGRRRIALVLPMAATSIPAEAGPSSVPRRAAAGQRRRTRLNSGS